MKSIYAALIVAGALFVGTSTASAHVNTQWFHHPSGVTCTDSLRNVDAGPFATRDACEAWKPVVASLVTASLPDHPELCYSHFGVDTLPDTNFTVEQAIPLVQSGQFWLATVTLGAGGNWLLGSDGKVYHYGCNQSGKLTGFFVRPDGQVVNQATHNDDVAQSTSNPDFADYAVVSK